ncbi:MAG TPA: S49 family peptidase [Gammaproteobacteria bacterium]|nr:S49 family peptidase [Gammaproteobacteria bacterium]
MKNILEYFARIFGQTLFAIISFFVIIFLFSLFFLGLGTGVGVSGSGFSKLQNIEQADYSYVSGDKDSDNKLLTVPVSGIILGSAPEEDFSFGLSDFLTYGYDIVDTLADAAKDKSIKGIFMPFRTPGGTIFGSQAIYRAIKKYREDTGNPVVVYIEGISASGGVMAMVAANSIYADYGSLIGSIGVLGPSLTYFNKPIATDGGLFGGGIVTKGGIEHTAITAGRGKDLGNPFRKPSEEEIANLRAGVNNEYENFVNHVAKNRNMEPEVIRNKMGAQIFDNKTAQAYGLIDGTQYRSEAISSLVKLAKLGDDYKLVKPIHNRKSLMNQLLGVIYKPSLSRLQSGQFAEQILRQQVCGNSHQLTLAYYGRLTNSICR